MVAQDLVFQQGKLVDAVYFVVGGSLTLYLVSRVLCRFVAAWGVESVDDPRAVARCVLQAASVFNVCDIGGRGSGRYPHC